MIESGLKSFPDVQEWSGVVGDPPKSPEGFYGYPVVVGWPYRMSGSCRETLPAVPEGWEAIPDVRQWSRGIP